MCNEINNQIKESDKSNIPNNVTDINILNENLSDIMLYHGSPNKDLTKLEIGKIDETGDQYGRGIYLTSNIQEAKQYAGPEGKVYKIELSSNLNLYNLNNKLPEAIKTNLLNELDNNKDIKNHIISFNRKEYIVIDKQEGLKFYHDKQDEWESVDNRWFGNRPQTTKRDGNIIVIYSDYSDIEGALDKLTGENLHSCLSGDVNPSVFVSLILSAGYDGIITHNNMWYIIYKNENDVKILENKIVESINYIPKQYKHMVKSFYKTPTGTWMIDLEDGYETSYGTNYIENKYKKDCIYELQNFVSNKLEESNYKLQEKSRNELLAKTKLQTKSRYNKASEYKGFSIADIDTTSIFTTNSLRVTCRVGNYWDTVEMEDILYWIQLEAEKHPDYQINTKGITAAIMNSIDGMDIKVDCNCRRFCI